MGVSWTIYVAPTSVREQQFDLSWGNHYTARKNSQNNLHSETGETSNSEARVELWEMPEVT